MADQREMEQEKQRSNSLRQARLKVWFPVRKKNNPWLFLCMYSALERRHSGLTVSALDSRPSSLGLSSGWGHCVVFLYKTRYFHTASLHQGV